MDYKSVDYSKIVSPIVLEFTLGGLQALMDTFDDLYPNFNVNDEVAVRKLFQAELASADYAINNQTNVYISNSFRYFLTKDNLDFSDVFDHCSYLPFQKPENPRKFFICMFEEMFPGTSWKMENTGNYLVTTNHLIHHIARNTDPLSYINSSDFHEIMKMFNFESKFKFKES
ncbi:hypothetical protein LPTSP4_19680 [Leptospira ryugenii]|uniref:Uncharacterized protein n=1 Tax=Leptospira ryugenii TaxID=1917863 RepID=A0A2P2E0N9_9LEPT|nr:hypothetical protein [Leptospira ryugenii]GBF50443.1 hypothetical protein LPTSP4_19680 [Leptospira ryugenii]